MPTWRIVRSGWERASVYLPIILMGVMALGTYWLARSTPTAGPLQAQKAARHEPDSIMRGFSVKTFDAQGRLKSEVFGKEARHYPDTDTFEIDEPRVRSFNQRDELTVATAKSGISNADGSEVQLIGNAIVTRDATVDKEGRGRPRLVFRGEFLHVFVETEHVRSHKPVELTRGNDTFNADSMEFDNIEQVMELKGRVRGVLQPGKK
ncbi:LPS export ABC transporter periplasmic protein LptC [Caenimonas koreensis DSM 17982]|uniref:LPS export ABC transporter periplasmic protein LptC n=1 Tax=Caenimonas koreensis DSM 17982 TaxID=1121255 RepID=A0A844ARC1_9BURK|nr:LPS export ABC transporter periplasmic protein LptC [Caenimonas koreensis DSM 17982]